MPQISRQTTIPTVIESKATGPSSSSKKERAVGFLKDPVSAVSRPVNTSESWAAYDFEMHARKCAYCHDPYEVHRHHEQLCDQGHRLAQEVVRCMYNRADGETYSTVEEDHKLVRIEVPAGYDQVRGLLKAIERSLRHRSRNPFVSMERTYYVAARAPQRTRSVKVEQAKSKPQPRSGEIVDWPKSPKPEAETPTEITNSSGARHESLYEQDIAIQRRNAKRYLVEVREPYSKTNSRSIGRSVKDEMQPPVAISDEDDKSSIASSNDGSIFSIKSLETLATDLSKSSGYSASQIAIATRELLLILQGDEVLRPLYIAAIQGDIGPQRFVNNFRRLLKAYSKNLKEEAGDRLDHLAAQLVAIKARYLAESILDNFCENTAAAKLPSKEMESTAKDDNSDDDDEEEPVVDEEIFQDLTIVREFLIDSNAFKTLRSQLQQFVLSPNSTIRKRVTQSNDHSFEESIDLTQREFTFEFTTPAFPSWTHPNTPENTLVGPKSETPRRSDPEPPLKTPRLDEREMEYDDIVSDLSHESDIISHISMDMNQADILDIRRLTQFVAQLPEVCQYHKWNLSKLGKNRFITSYCAIFESYYHKLQNEAEGVQKAPFQMHQMEVLQIESHRISIANGIVEYIQTVDEKYKKKANDNVQQPKDNTFLNSWLASQRELEGLNTKQQSVPGFSDSEREEEVDEEKTVHEDLLEFSNISYMEMFLRQRASFNALVLDIRLLSLRSSLREIVESVPKNSIEISSVNDTSLINKTKGYLEDYTRLEWDWWPLAPRVHDLQPGKMRLEWKFCGQTLYQNVSLEEANVIHEISETVPNHPRNYHCCERNEQRMTWNVFSDRIFACLSNLLKKQTSSASLDGSKSSEVSERSTSLESSPANSSTADSQGASQGIPNSTDKASCNSSLQTQGQKSSAYSNSAQKNPNWILFGVQGFRWSLELEQIKLSSLINDPMFFRELKARYKRHRGWLKLLLSPFRFRFCRFVKFEKFDTHRVLSHGEDLPDYHGFEYDYDYAPRPGKNPLITPKTFAVCLKACQPSCIWPLFNPWHDCVRIPPRSDRLRCIPKKKSEFDVASDDVGMVAWGLEADYALSFAFLAAYHLIPILAALGFWVYWLVKHPGDWQNSAVPILTVLALIAVFWMPFGKQLGMI